MLVRRTGTTFACMYADIPRTRRARACVHCCKRRMLGNEQEAWVFMEPVDTVKLGLHDYSSIITRPMDLGCLNPKS